MDAELISSRTTSLQRGAKSALLLLVLLGPLILLAHPGAALTVSVAVGTAPQGLAYDSAKGEVFVSNPGSNSVSVISDASGSMVATVTHFAGPLGLAYDSAKGEVFVANYAGNTVSVISDASNSVVANVTVGTAPQGLAYDSAKGEVFVANAASGVAVISDTSNSDRQRDREGQS